MKWTPRASRSPNRRDQVRERAPEAVELPDGECVGLLEAGEHLGWRRQGAHVAERYHGGSPCRSSPITGGRWHAAVRNRLTFLSLGLGRSARGTLLRASPVWRARRSPQ